MRGPRRPVFLAPTPYRRRRLRDAARLLPLAAILLLILPALWSPMGEGDRRLSGDVVYFFLLWLGLILVAAAFAPGLSRPPESGDRDED